MDPTKIVRIKQAIRNNFDSSGDPYEDFETKHEFFQMLTERILANMKLPQRADILDVGCGTGASCRAILRALPLARVWGLDISRAMLEKAKQHLGDEERLILVEGDAARLTEYFTQPFDAVIYAASIFLIPDYRESLRQSWGLLQEGGSVGLTFMDGVYDPQGRNLLQIADQAAGEGVSLKKPVQWSELEMFVSEIFPVHRIWQERFLISLDVLRDFFSVPAMSAGLFPGLPYSERVRKVKRLFDHLISHETLFSWMFVVGKKLSSP